MNISDDQKSALDIRNHIIKLASNYIGLDNNTSITQLAGKYCTFVIFADETEEYNDLPKIKVAFDFLSITTKINRIVFSYEDIFQIHFEIPEFILHGTIELTLVRLSISLIFNSDLDKDYIDTTLEDYSILCTAEFWSNPCDPYNSQIFESPFLIIPPDDFQN